MTAVKEQNMMQFLGEKTNGIANVVQVPQAPLRML